MKQLSLTETGFLLKAGKQTRKEVFPAVMETVNAVVAPGGLIEPFYPKKGGRPPMPLSRTLRIHFMQRWFGYSDLSVLTPTKKPVGGELTEEQKAFNRMLLAVRAIVEHPFRVVKLHFGFVKVRYLSLAKNTGQIVTLFALANLRLARKRLVILLGEVRP